MPELNIDMYYNEFKGVENGWASTNIPVYIDPQSVKSKHLNSIVEYTQRMVSLYNALFDAEFHFAGLKPLVQPPQEPNIMITLDLANNPPMFAKAAPTANSDLSWRIGGWMVLYAKAFPKYWKPWRKFWKVLIHEMGHCMGASHTSLTPSMIRSHVDVSKHCEGFMPWDIAVITKFMLGFHRDEDAPFPIPVNMKPHIVRVEKDEKLFLPIVKWKGEDCVAIMENTAENAWRPIYMKKLKNTYFHNPEHYNFKGVALLDDDAKVLTFTEPCIGGDRLGMMRMVRDTYGVWRFM